ncbi:prephenate dehydrogenase/arogenate dehydrogenase family protein [Bacteroidota bacterium]
MKNKVVSIYGYGRFGRLWAGILAKDFKVKVYSRRGLQKEDVEYCVEIADEKDIFNCDALFFCVAISSFEEVLKQSKSFHNENTVYFDTCSVKVEPARWMKENLPANSQLIATHPMFGPDSYSPKEKMPMVMCNVRAENTEFDFWVDYFSSRNMNIEVMTPDKHDESAAYSQGITHYIGRVLSDLNLSPTMIDTLGYKKLMEIIEQTCNDAWQLFVDLQKYNPYTRKMRTDLHESIEKIYAYLNSDSKE